MGITRFIYLLLILATFFLLSTQSDKEVVVKKEEKPMVTFKNSVMYEIDTNSVSQVIQSQTANVYKTYEELYNATIIAKSSETSQESNTLSANHMVKIRDDIFLNGEVFLSTSNGITFKSEDLHYNLKTKVAVSKANFKAFENQSSFEGSNLYYDGINDNIKIKNAHFKIDLENEDNNDTK